jgi:pantoate--beta-alanine ligase
MNRGKVHMQVLTTIVALSQWRAAATPPVGFVPTMGSLHDFQHYPRDLNRDLRLLETVQVDAVFTPAVDEMYPTGASTMVEVESLSSLLEGASRPGHFRGVATVVCKLFHLVQPARAYFGEKDYQQLQVIQHMVHDLRMPIEVIGCPTIREPDALAMSSRNVYLNALERQAAVILSRALFRAEYLCSAGERNVFKLQAEVQKILATEPLVRTDYVAIVHPHTLQPVTTLGSAGGRLCLAVWIGKTRLIDNIRLEGS